LKLTHKRAHGSINAEFQNSGLPRAGIIESATVYRGKSRPPVSTEDTTELRETAANNRILIVVCSTVGAILVASCLVVLVVRRRCPLDEPYYDDRDGAEENGNMFERKSFSSEDEVIEVMSKGREISENAVVPFTATADSDAEEQARIDSELTFAAKEGDIEMSGLPEPVAAPALDGLPAAPSKPSIHGIRLEPLNVTRAISHAQNEEKLAKRAMTDGLAANVAGALEQATTEAGKAASALASAKQELGDQNDTRPRAARGQEVATLKDEC